MFHPLIKTLAIRPHLLIDHLGGYVDLAGVQIAEAMRSLRTRALLVGALAVALLLAAMLSGTALLLLAAIPLERMAMPWLLWTVPGAFWLLALLLLALLSAQARIRHFEPLREQLAADAALLREVSER
jgi:integral membrane sensor domain MASE1